MKPLQVPTNVFRMSDMLLGLSVSMPSEIYEEVKWCMIAVWTATGKTKGKGTSSFSSRMRSMNHTPTLQNGLIPKQQGVHSRPRSLRTASSRHQTTRDGSWICQTLPRKARGSVCVGSMGACGEKHVFSFGGSLELQSWANVKYRN